MMCALRVLNDNDLGRLVILESTWQAVAVLIDLSRCKRGSLSAPFLQSPICSGAGRTCRKKQRDSVTSIGKG